MPKQGQSVETCIITKWFKKKGDTIAIGDILFSYETDKASFDLESAAEGELLDTFFGEGSEVPVLTNVAVIGKKGESSDSFRPGSSVPVSSASNIPPDEYSQATIKIVPESSPSGKKIRISPRARKMAEKEGFRYENLIGSGPNGRIIAKDIEGKKSAGTTNKAGEEFSDQSLSNVRKLIAKAMHSSLQNSAQLTHHMSADVRSLLEARQKIKTQIAANKFHQDITLNDMVCWCVIRALEKFPAANSHFLENRIRTFNKIHLGLAVDTNRGLMVPAIKNADDLDLISLSRELKNIADMAKKGNIDPELIAGSAASFTVSNLGNYGVEMFTPVVNLPQVAILGVCTIINRPANIGNNTMAFVPFMGLSLTYDHRAIDGGPATLFLREIKEQIEAFRYLE